MKNDINTERIKEVLKSIVALMVADVISKYLFQSSIYAMMILYCIIIIIEMWISAWLKRNKR